jgi:alpha/beta superfamily hydrolase
MKKSFFIQSAGKKIYVELGFPKKVPAPAVIIGHGLRSYYPGFLNMFAKAMRDAGYISVVFHFLGTGKSDGKFEDKTTAAMLLNYEDVLAFLKKSADVRGIGVVGRSNAGSLAILHGPDDAIKAYCFLAPPLFYSLGMTKFVKSAKIRGEYFYHKSYKRPHTKGPGRLPLTFLTELKKYDPILLKNVPKLKPVIYFQSTKDEAVLVSDGHYDYYRKNLPQPRKIVLIKGGNHSFKGHKRFVINETVKWFKRYLKQK